MSEREYVAMLLDMVERGVITPAEMESLHDAFVDGELDDNLPIVPPEADDKDYLLLVWGALSRRPSQQRRERSRDSLRQEFNSILVASNTSTLRQWQRETWQNITNYTYSQWYAGAGQQTQPTPQLEEQVAEEALFFQRFVGDVGARQAVGRPYSNLYVANRSLRYGATGWAAWYMGNEAADNRGSGWVYQYVPIDDRQTCRNCHGARGYYLAGQGPMPGQICLGGWACRCVRRAVYLPSVYQRLIAS